MAFQITTPEITTATMVLMRENLKETASEETLDRVTLALPTEAGEEATLTGTVSQVRASVIV